MLKRMTNRTILLAAAMTLLAATALSWVLTYRFGWRLDLSVLGASSASASLGFAAFLVDSSGLAVSIGSPLLAMHFASQRAIVTKRIK